MKNFSSLPRSLLVVLGLALLIRLAAVAILPPTIADDSPWYLDRGKQIVTNTVSIKEYITFGPLYALLAGSSNAILGRDNAILFLRLLQAVLGTAVCGLVWRIAHKLTNDTRIATLAGLGIALNPIFIIDGNGIVTEPLFVFLLVWALAVYICQPVEDTRRLAASGSLFALATLTRAMSVLFPVGLAIHLMLVMPWKRALRGAAILLVIYVAVVSTWTVYNLVKFNRFFFAASGAGDFLYAGTVGYNGSKSVDINLAQNNNGNVPSGQARDIAARNTFFGAISANPVGYFVGQSKKLAAALLQPHQTTYFPGPSLKMMTAQWLRADRSIGGLAALLSDPTFWPKLILYLFHYLALTFGAVGIVLTLREWKLYAPLSGFVVYTLLLHLFLLVVPRYLFPIMPVLWIFAAIAMVRMWSWLRARNWAVGPINVQNRVEAKSMQSAPGPEGPG